MYRNFHNNQPYITQSNNCVCRTCLGQLIQAKRDGKKKDRRDDDLEGKSHVKILRETHSHWVFTWRCDLPVTLKVKHITRQPCTYIRTKSTYKRKGLLLCSFLKEFLRPRI